MKTFGQQVLVLGGFYFIIFFLSSLGKGPLFEIFDLILFMTFICLLIGLCFKRKYHFLTNFQKRFWKSSNYLLGLGVIQYFTILCVTLPGMIYGYKTSQAHYNGLGVIDAPVKYFQIISYVYWFLFFLVLIGVTYWNFKQNKTRKVS